MLGKKIGSFKMMEKKPVYHTLVLHSLAKAQLPPMDILPFTRWGRRRSLVPCNVNAFQEMASVVESCNGKCDLSNLIKEFV
nr:auxin-induced protein 15A-like [Tanacetum cinerariifolium]